MLLYFTIASTLQLDCAEMEKIVKSWLLLDLRLMMIETTFVMQDFFNRGLIFNVTLISGDITLLLKKLILKFSKGKWRYVTIEMGSKESDCLFCQTLKTNTKLVERFLMKLAVFGKLVSSRLLEDCFKVYWLAD